MGPLAAVQLVQRRALRTAKTNSSSLETTSKTMVKVQLGAPRRTRSQAKSGQARRRGVKAKGQLVDPLDILNACS